MDTHVAPFSAEENNIRILVPLDVLQTERMTLTLELSDGRFFRQVVPMHDSNNENLAPVLLSLTMPEGGIETFEARPFNSQPYKLSAKVSIDNSDPLRGGVLMIANSGLYNQRLNANLIKSFDPIATPLIQLRYKGDPMAIVSLSYGEFIFAFSEPCSTHVRFNKWQLASMDHQWHVWTGVPYDSVGTFSLSERCTLPTAQIRIGSRKAPDQTGLRSILQVDDITCGPAVGPQKPFAFKADFVDPDGVGEVVYGILAGDIAFDNRAQDEQYKVVWLPAKNATVVEPELHAVPEGIHHLVVRARDRRGAWSQVSDVPFMLDRKPPAIKHVIDTVTHYNGSRLTLTVTDQVAPPVLNTIRFTCLGTPLDLKTAIGSCTVATGTLTFDLDWIWLLRAQLAKTKDGAILPLSVGGIMDAAGNACPPLKIDIPIDYKADKRPPTILTPKLSKNLLYGEFTLNQLTPFFDAQNRVVAKTVTTPEGRVIEITPENGRNVFIRHTFAPAWDSDKYPWLALSFRTMDAPRAKAFFSLGFNTGTRRPRGIKDAHMFDFNDTNHLKYVVGSLNLKTGIWNNVIINARDFLRDETADRKETPDITYLSLFFQNNKNNDNVMQIRSLSILASWESTDVIPIHAYDLSGIKGLVGPKGLYETTLIRPANLSNEIPDHSHWFPFRVSDQQGNLSDTWMIPIPPDSKKTEPALPGLSNIPF